MAVLVKNVPEASPRLWTHRLALESWAGVVYVLGSLGLVFYAIPTLWEMAVSPWLAPAVGTPVSVTFQILVMLAAAAGLLLLGARLVGANPVHGLRAGVFVGIVEILAAFLITVGVGNLFQRWFAGTAPTVGVGLTLAVGVGLLVLAVASFLWPRTERAIQMIEDQGWFTAAGYKKSQGKLVRRGTILGILVVAGCGIYTLLHHGALNAAAPHWQVTLPFTEGRYVVLLPDIRYTVPLLLAAASLWIAYRVVNLPVFADFLIATEAELNKVSWTTRRRLIQDTIVVLVTVVLLTVFLFVVDQGWAFVLTKIRVLQTPPAAQQVGPKEQPW
jgi:preprotein translocase SecE subunit